MEQADEQQFYNLLLLVEEQQKATAAAVAAIVQERLELAASADMLKQAATILPRAFGEAMAREMRESMGDTQKAAVGALNQARGALVKPPASSGTPVPGSGPGSPWRIAT